MCHPYANAVAQDDQVPARPPLTPKQEAYARAEAARQAKKERRNAAP